MCPTALGRKEKKLYNVHIVQWQTLYILKNVSKGAGIFPGSQLVFGTLYNLPGQVE